MSQQTQGACGGEPRGPRHRGRAPRRGDITAATGNAQVHVAALDLADQASVASGRP
jgi:hypothetical protein